MLKSFHLWHTFSVHHTEEDVIHVTVGQINIYHGILYMFNRIYI